MDSPVDVLLIIETDFATTQLVEQILHASAAHGIRTTKRLLDNLVAADFGADKLPLFVRCGDPRARVWTDALAAANLPYVYYIDDNFWHIAGTTMLANYYRHPMVRRSLESNIAHARTVIAGSSELAQFLSRFNYNIVVLPAFVDFSLIDAGPPAPQTDEIRIGFAGSPSRVSDLGLISPIISRVLEKHPQAVFEFVGAFPVDVAESDRVRRFPYLETYSSYIRWQRERGWAIGLAPLADHAANRSKTDNKYREYGAFGYAGVYSSIPPYSHVVQQGETGLLVANTADAWLDALNDLLTDAGKRQAMGRAAAADVRARYDITQVSHSWAEMIRATSAMSHDDVKPIDEGLLRRKLAFALVHRWRLQAELLYREGGIRLVIVRSARKVLRRLFSSFNR